MQLILHIMGALTLFYVKYSSVVAAGNTIIFNVHNLRNDRHIHHLAYRCITYICQSVGVSKMRTRTYIAIL